ncbi:signal recognition particle protein [Candidatus Woesearchaeota archaeon]|nr:MAG: signal recognition particle protein [Candidatus Woesearchaeota archaeon]
MVLDKLGESLRSTIKKVTKSLFVDEKLVNELVKDIQRALLQSDANVQLVFEVTRRIKERALKEDCPKGLTKQEFLINIVYEELVSFLGGEAPRVIPQKKPFTIMLVGLFGNGKTTTAGKLAHFYKKRGLKVVLIQTDTWRPAALDQLEQLGKRIGVPVFGVKGAKDPVKIVEAADTKGADVVIVDTAGRDALSEDLIEELDRLSKVVRPDETLLVMAGDVGQAAQRQAEAFHETCHVTGVVITKLDGTAKGGGALIACSVTGAPVKFIGVGEKLDEFEIFDPKRFVGRLLGMGDLEGLLEKAREAISEEEAQDLGRKFLKGDFNLLDLYQQMEAVRKMGPLSRVLELVPGMSSLPLPKESLKVQEEKLKLWRYAMDSMTREELERPEELNASRIGRVARGAGVDPSEVRSLLKQYRQSKKLVKMLGGGGSEKDVRKLMQKLQKGGVAKF